MSASRLKRLKLKLDGHQKNQYAVAQMKYREQYGYPENKEKLHMLERILMGKDPLEGLEKQG